MKAAALIGCWDTVLRLKAVGCPIQPFDGGDAVHVLWATGIPTRFWFGPTYSYVGIPLVATARKGVFFTHLRFELDGVNYRWDVCRNTTDAFGWRWNPLIDAVAEWKGEVALNWYFFRTLQERVTAAGILYLFAAAEVLPAITHPPVSAQLWLVDRSTDTCYGCKCELTGATHDRPSPATNVGTSVGGALTSIAHPYDLCRVAEPPVESEPKVADSSSNGASDEVIASEKTTVKPSVLARIIEKCINPEPDKGTKWTP